MINPHRITVLNIKIPVDDDTRIPLSLCRREETAERQE